jgi:trk system potassium uptake protein TrkA
LAKHVSPSEDSVVVIGLGRFGGAVAQSLVALGHEVMGIDADLDLVQQWSKDLTHVVQADTTDIDTLKALGVGEFRCVVVGIGSNVEASLLTVLGLGELGVPAIWAKANSARQGRILERIGAHHVVYPEADMGERVAHLVTGKMIDFMQFEDNFAIASTMAPREAIGKSLTEAGLRAKYGVTVVAIKRLRADFSHAGPDSRVENGDLLIVAGPTRNVEHFAAIT